MGYNKDHSFLAIGASPDLLEAAARLQLHAFSEENARQELRASAAALAERGPLSGGLMVPCLGRGAGLYGEHDVEINELTRALGPLALTGFLAGGEIGPVGSRTFVHTYTTTIGLLREAAS